MKKKIVLIGFLFIKLFFPDNCFSQSSGSRKDVTSQRSDLVSIEKIESDISQAVSLVEENHIGGDRLDYNKLFKSSIGGMLNSLDPHSSYFDAEDFAEFRADQSSQYFGIGATIGNLSDPGGKSLATYIKATFENSPAWRGGLRYGDKILVIDGESMINKSSSEVSNYLRGPRGTKVKIVVGRFGSGIQENIEITRDSVFQPSIPEAYLIRPGVGYIAMTGGFNRTTFAEFSKAMSDLKAQGMTDLILDLRGNGGGLVVQAYRVANIFLKSGQVVFTQKGRLDGVGETNRAENPNPERIPLLVLINQGTASASEILAGALQDHDRALIVGENSFGKGLVQNPFLLEYGSMLLLTIAKYETPSGRLIQRDYSNRSLYNYFTNFDGVKADKGIEAKTDNGRPVYAGGGIMPDEVVKLEKVSPKRVSERAKLLDPIFSFALNLSFGKIAGFDAYQINRAITYNHKLQSADFNISHSLFLEFKSFAMEKYKIPASVIENERDFVEKNLRAELVTAAYGITPRAQVFREWDIQLTRALELLPKARQLAFKSANVTSLKN